MGFPKRVLISFDLSIKESGEYPVICVGRKGYRNDSSPSERSVMVREQYRTILALLLIKQPRGDFTVADLPQLLRGSEIHFQGSLKFGPNY